MARTPQGIVFGANAVRTWLAQHGQLNERAVATTFERTFDSRWRYDMDAGEWLQWVDDMVWARGQTLVFLDAIGRYVNELAIAFRRYDAITNTEAKQLKSQRSVAALERICRGLPSFLARSSMFDADPYMLGTPGGTVDLRTGLMTPARPEDYITILTPYTPAPPGTPMPLFQGFMDEVMAGDRDLQRTMQQWAGNSATGSAAEQKIMFLYGSGRNGKGVFCRTIAYLLGGHVASAPRDLLMEQRGQQHPVALVNVVLSRMTLASEIPEGATWDSALIKQLTGGDEMQVRRMRENLFQVKPRCTITVMGNLRPALKTVDAAVRERFLVVTFPVFIPEERRVPDLEQRFTKAEGPAILRWIIDGAVDRHNSPALHIAKAITVDTADYMAEEDIMADFIQDTFIRESEDTEHNQIYEVETSTAFQLWRGYCAQFGRQPGARNPFTTAMKNASIGFKRDKKRRYFTGIRNRLDVGY